MPSLKQRVKRETSLDKIRNGRLKSTEPTVYGRTEYDTDTSLVCILCKISLHSVATGVRLSQNVNSSDCKFKTYLTGAAFLPYHEGQGLRP
jgi:hypothetical protein